MKPVRFNAVWMVAVLGQVALLAVVSLAVGLTSLGWIVGMTCAVTTAVLLARSGQAMGPADWVTLTRMLLTGTVAGLVPQYPTPALALLAAVALSLDWVDGQVARRTGTCSARGARFDMEVDAFLILVLSIPVAAQIGWWVLIIGAARYVFVAGAWVWPWLARPLPYRYWRKVVAAVQGIALLVVVTGWLPIGVARFTMMAALLLLGESFGRDVVWLWRRRNERAAGVVAWQEEATA